MRRGSKPAGSSMDPYSTRNVGSAGALASDWCSLLLTATSLGTDTAPPPGWIQDAAGAELWAYLIAIGESMQIPGVVTDCKGILDGLRRSRHDLVHEKAALARTWNLILAGIDNQLAEAAASTTWMPSHISAARMASNAPRDSDGHPITWIGWRANRLADSLAKFAAASSRLPSSFFEWLKEVDDLHLHQAALLGMVTHAANNIRPSTMHMICKMTLQN